MYRRIVGAAAACAAIGLLATAPATLAVPPGLLNGDEGGTASEMRELIDELVANGNRLPVRPAGTVGVLNTSGANAQRDIQVNDPLVDGIQTFPGGPPFIRATQSETTMASVGSTVVVGYNTSAGANFVDAQGDVSQLLLSGVSVSHDGGRTWSSGFVPPPAGDIFTFGDPSLTTDRRGNFYYASLNYPGLQVNRSSDGEHWSPGTTIVKDSGADKEWIAAGPDPTLPARDNLYVTWTHYGSRSSDLRMVRSTDGGLTWSRPTVLFAPKAGGVYSSYIQFSNPVVDASTGRLYVPFLHYSNIDADFIRVLVSDDGGRTFTSLKFNISGAPDAGALPAVQPGALSDCGKIGGLRLGLHQGDATPAPNGFPRWLQTTRLTMQPAMAAVNGKLFIAFNASTSPDYGAGTGSVIKLLYSPDSGQTWAPPVTAVTSTTSEPQHVLPSIATSADGSSIALTYFKQLASGRIAVDRVLGAAAQGTVSFGRPSSVAAPFDLPPTNITVEPDLTLNYDSVIVPCYALGEYTATAWLAGGPAAAFGGGRQLFKEPPGGLVDGVHSQMDAFFAPIG